MLAEAKLVSCRCQHCGEDFEREVNGENAFCCIGCEQVYFLLKENNLGQYYDLEKFPGTSRKGFDRNSLDYLDDPDAYQRLISFKDDKVTKIHFFIPAIHCASCLWLLEHLYTFHEGIKQNKVDFLEKKVYITFDHNQIDLKEIVTILHKIGYEPALNLASLENAKVPKRDRSLITKIGVAGFSFGNIMLLSFPEYLGFSGAFKSYYLGYLNLVLALPIFFYSGFDYIKDAFKDIRRKHLGIHAPLALGMMALFGRSVYEVTFGFGEGYFDSFSGFVFFLLVGQWFQRRAQGFIHFERDYKSYFPISVHVKIDSTWVSKSLDKIQERDIFKVGNEQIIPCDGILLNGDAMIDYSFVTGESDPQKVKVGDPLYSGGKQIGAPIEIEAIKSVDQSYLTQLWHDETFTEKRSSHSEKLLDKISKYFTLIILFIATLTFIFWSKTDLPIAYEAAIAVLIVACPCALALSVPFLLGSAMRILAKQDFHVKSVETIEKLADIDTIIFDKTGTITENKSLVAMYSGTPLTLLEKALIHSVASASSHPLSKAIAHATHTETIGIVDFQEEIGKGISALCQNKTVRIGSGEFIYGVFHDQNSRVYVEVSGKVLGFYTFRKQLRSNIEQIIHHFSSYELAMLSGDSDRERLQMEAIFPPHAVLRFNQSPSDKLQYIKELQANDKKVLMIGDGLNDAGALKQSDVGMVIVEDSNNFTPACDVIISTKALTHYHKIHSYFKKLKWSLYGAFAIAFAYNLIGLSFAVTGHLTPLVAAILMPISSITIIFYSLFSSLILARKIR